MTFRILHTADWQIGKQFGRITGDAGAMLREQRFETVRAIAELAAERRVDAVLVAGDVFEDNAVSDETLRRTINVLEAYTGPWVLLPGNHDAARAQSVWTRMRTLEIVPDNVIFATRPQPIQINDGPLWILPAPLQRRHEIRDLTEYFDTAETSEAAIRIGLAHGSVQNRLPDTADAMNPIAEDRAESARLDYLALGDWHGTLNIAPGIWYSGTPEQDRFKQNEPGNALLVEFEQSGDEPRVEVLPVGKYRWHRIDSELDGTESIEALAEQLSTFETPQNHLVDLRLQGMIDLEERGRLEEVLEAARADLRFLDVDDTALKATPSADDLLAMEATGFIKDTIKRLADIQDDPDDPASPHATRALQLLYFEQLALRGKR